MLDHAPLPNPPHPRLQIASFFNMAPRRPFGTTRDFPARHRFCSYSSRSIALPTASDLFLHFPFFRRCDQNLPLIPFFPFFPIVPPPLGILTKKGHYRPLCSSEKSSKDHSSIPLVAISPFLSTDPLCCFYYCFRRFYGDFCPPLLLRPSLSESDHAPSGHDFSSFQGLLLLAASVRKTPFELTASLPFPLFSPPLFYVFLLRTPLSEENFVFWLCIRSLRCELWGFPLLSLSLCYESLFVFLSLPPIQLTRKRCVHVPEWE